MKAIVLLFSCLSAWSAAVETAAAPPGRTNAASKPAAVRRASAAPSAGAVDARSAAEKGLALYRRDRASLEARRLLEQASIRLPNRNDVHLALLDCDLVRGDLEAATASLRRLAPQLEADERLAFDAVYYLLQYGQLALAQEQWSGIHDRIQAKAQRNAASVTKSELGEDVFVQGLLAAGARQNAEAIRLLHQADGYEFPPLNSRLMLVLADTLYELGEDGLAVPTYREYLQRWPDDRQARVHMAVSLHACRESVGAQKELERVLEGDPRFPEANYSLGVVFFDQKRNDEAKVHFERELALDPRCHACMAKLAHVAYLAGDDQGCEAWLQKAAALDPAWDETNLVYGMLEIRAGKYESAVQHLTRVVEHLPEHSQAHYQLAIAYQRSGNESAAAEHARTFKRLTEQQKAPAIGQPR